MKKLWSDRRWNDYLYWQETDKTTLRKINNLLKDIERNANTGIGKPEPLKHYDGYWSRRIDAKNRLVYKVCDGAIIVAQCRGHYDTK